MAMKKSDLLYKSYTELGPNCHLGFLVRRTTKGVAVEKRYFAADKKDMAMYYEQYPELPKNWDESINAYGTKAAQYWLSELEYYEPYRIAELKKGE